MPRNEIARSWGCLALVDAASYQRDSMGTDLPVLVTPLACQHSALPVEFILIIVLVVSQWYPPVSQWF